jgi:hypothetical protein
VSSVFASSISYAANEYQQAPFGFGAWIEGDGQGEILSSLLGDSNNNPFLYAGAFIDGVWTSPAVVNWSGTFKYVYIPFTPSMTSTSTGTATRARPSWPMTVWAPLQIICPTLAAGSTLNCSLTIWGPTLINPPN